MLHTTFRRVKEAAACIESYRKFAKFKGGVRKWGKDTPFGLDEVLGVCGLEGALWCLGIVIEPADKEIRLLACDYAEHVLPIFEREYPKDKRPRQAIETSRRFAVGEATQEELNTVRVMAWAAGITAWTAGAVAGDAAEAAGDAGDATRAAGNAAGAAGDADWDAERKWEEKVFIKMLKVTE